jgi:transcriptional regulator with XRE-family HTH domain
MDWQRIVGANILRRRNAIGATQEDIAGAAELDVGYLGRIERGQRNPSLKKLVRIAAALGVLPGKLFSAPK